MAREESDRVGFGHGEASDIPASEYMRFEACGHCAYVHVLLIDARGKAIAQGTLDRAMQKKIEEKFAEAEANVAKSKR